VRSEFLHGAVLQDGDGAAFPDDGCAELLDVDGMVLLEGGDLGSRLPRCAAQSKKQGSGGASEKKGSICGGFYMPWAKVWSSVQGETSGGDP
jgi:hypothetical protein